MAAWVRALEYLEREGATPSPELAQALDLRDAWGGLCRRLVRHGLVECGLPGPRRVRLYWITDAGREQLARARAVVVELALAMTGDLD